LTNYVLDQFGDEFDRLGLNEAVKANCYRIKISVPTIYTIPELYCSSTGTFFTPVRELGLAFHEMWEVSKLPMGNCEIT